MTKNAIIPDGWAMIDAGEYAVHTTEQGAYKAVQELSNMFPNKEFMFIYSPEANNGKGYYFTLYKMDSQTLKHWREHQERERENNLQKNRIPKKSTKPKRKRCKCK